MSSGDRNTVLNMPASRARNSSHFSSFNADGRPARLTHLRELEAESIHILRELVAQFENPVMLYSIGKDSSVMLHLAMKTFHPSKPPFPHDLEVSRDD
tara:strand:- start:354 stop:647 length:294 start_codon:yes stop_codon:yes gene_type:complete